ncbi:hypothetical protein CAI16_20150, partial [Virgibacillus dokdonensis]
GERLWTGASIIPAGKVLKLVKAGGVIKFADKGKLQGKKINANNKSNSTTLLASEGKAGTFKQLAKQGTAFDNITPHHMPSAKK